MNKLNRRVERGSPWRRPTLEKGCPNLEPNVILEVVLT